MHLIVYWNIFPYATKTERTKKDTLDEGVSGATCSSGQDLLLALSSHITSDGLEGPYVVPGY